MMMEQADEDRAEAFANRLLQNVILETGRFEEVLSSVVIPCDKRNDKRTWRVTSLCESLFSMLASQVVWPADKPIGFKDAVGDHVFTGIRSMIKDAAAAWLRERSGLPMQVIQDLVEAVQVGQMGVDIYDELVDGGHVPGVSMQAAGKLCCGARAAVGFIMRPGLVAGTAADRIVQAIIETGLQPREQVAAAMVKAAVSQGFLTPQQAVSLMVDVRASL